MLKRRGRVVVGRGAATVVIDRTVDKGVRGATVYEVN